MLNFGREVQAGTAVPCLICDRTFIAPGSAGAGVSGPQPMPAASAPVIPPPNPEPLPRTPPAGAPTANGTRSDPAPAPVAVPKAGRIPSALRDPAASSGATILTVIAVFLAGVMLLLLAGVGILVWQLSAHDVGATPAPVAQGPVAPPVGGDDTAPAAPAGGEAEKKNDMPSAGGAPVGGGVSTEGGEVDVADLKKAEKPAPAPTLTERNGKPAAETPPPPSPTVPVVINAGGAPGVEQQRIDAAIDKGVQYLKDHQLGDGSWPGGPPVGYTALAGLTLLECKVSPDDPKVQKAAAFVRGNVARLNKTYELSLAILFLDRLGNPKDNIVIQGLALRLLAGQNEAGGWTYDCPLLTPNEMHHLLVFLQSHRPELPKGMNAKGNASKQAEAEGALAKQAKPDGAMPKQTKEEGATPKQAKEKSGDPFEQLAELLMPKQIQSPDGSPKAADPAGSLPKQEGASGNSDPKQPAANKPTGSAGGPEEKPKSPTPAQLAEAMNKDKNKPAPNWPNPVPPNKLPPALQKLPVVEMNWLKGRVKARNAGGDNSNTQFALLAMWAARRHDVPTEYAHKLGQQRFAISQNGDGGWGYLMGDGSRDTMTCVGLLGLAMGHGALPGAAKPDDKANLEDPAIREGLRALGRWVGAPAKGPDPRPGMQNLYLLWSIERVAMLYDLKTIGGKDWYAWGAQTLLPNQQPDGHWLGAHFHGHTDHTDTCLALLFLRRSNLVPDLTENLRLFMAIRDPEGK
jgi:hypothetical protein